MAGSTVNRSWKFWCHCSSWVNFYRQWPKKGCFAGFLGPRWPTWKTHLARFGGPRAKAHSGKRPKMAEGHWMKISRGKMTFISVPSQLLIQFFLLKAQKGLFAPFSGRRPYGVGSLGQSKIAILAPTADENGLIEMSCETRKGAPKRPNWVFSNRPQVCLQLYRHYHPHLFHHHDINYHQGAQVKSIPLDSIAMR